MEFTEQYLEDTQERSSSIEHSWEAPIQKSWENIIVDPETGHLLGDTKQLETIKAQRQKRIQSAETQDKIVEKGLLRYLVVIVDLSKCMDSTDIKPSRKVFLGTVLKAFVTEYFDQNPLCNLGIILGRDRVGSILTELSGSPTHQINCLMQELEKPHSTSGEFSLQNTLIRAQKLLNQVPDHGSKEVLVVTGSLTTTDPGDIFETIKGLQKDCVRVSLISLTAQVYLHSIIAKHTFGKYLIPLDENKIQDSLLEFTKPLPAESSLRKNQTNTRKWVWMGFPQLHNTTVPQQCVCHSTFVYEFYECPRCFSYSCEIPSTCRGCGLVLLSSVHLARSYHHLIPLPIYTELDQLSSTVSCIGCSAKPSNIGISMVKCILCNSPYCLDCEDFVRSVLYHCPTC